MTFYVNSLQSEYRQYTYSFLIRTPLFFLPLCTEPFVLLNYLFIVENI